MTANLPVAFGRFLLNCSTQTLILSCLLVLGSLSTGLSFPSTSFAATNDWAEGSQTLADGASRNYYNRAAKLEWTNYLGDVHDAANVSQGEQPYATTAIEDTDSPRYIQWEVTSLVQKWHTKPMVIGDFF